MKLAAIYNVWSDWDLLEHSVKNMRPLVDGVIIVGSHKSNYGEISEIPEKWINPDLIQFEPKEAINPMGNETAKRNHGLHVARLRGYTHFIMMDADEFHNPVEFLKEKQKFIDNPNLLGLVCATQVYFKSPTLTIGLDTTLVPFIHKITDGLHHRFNQTYPFAWIDGKIKIDPTRSLNISSGVEWSDIVCHHYSWIRSDYGKKIRNSTAKSNIERSTIREDLENAKPGYFCKFYQKTLHQVPNYFNLPE